MAAKIFEEWWGEKYSGKLGQTIIEKAFKEVAEEAWEAATIEKFTSTNKQIMPCPRIPECNNSRNTFCQIMEPSCFYKMGTA